MEWDHRPPSRPASGPSPVQITVEAFQPVPGCGSTSLALLSAVRCLRLPAQPVIPGGPDAPRLLYRWGHPNTHPRYSVQRHVHAVGPGGLGECRQQDLVDLSLNLRTAALPDPDHRQGHHGWSVSAGRQLLRRPPHELLTGVRVPPRILAWPAPHTSQPYLG